MKDYLKYAKNIFSQNGEDGILEELCKDLNITSGLLVEFGAWDGLHLSNAYNLLRNNKNFRGFLIESDYSKFLELQKIQNKEGNRIITSNKLISFKDDDPNNLDNLIEQYNLQNEKIAMISIDIDSYDYYVAQSIKKYLPDIFIIETITNFKKDEEHIGFDGCSLFSLNKLMNEKGYNLVCFCGNGIYVKKELIDINLDPQKYYLNYDQHVDLQRINNFGQKINDIYYLTKDYNNFIKEIKKEYE
jgi:hypothetical protein